MNMDWDLKRIYRKLTQTQVSRVVKAVKAIQRSLKKKKIQNKV